MKKANIKEVLKNEYVFSIITRVLSIFLSLAHSILIARFLGAELKGEMSYVSSVASVCCIVVSFGMHQAYPYLRKTYGKDRIYENYVGVIRLIFTIYFMLALITSLFFINSNDIILKSALETEKAIVELKVFMVEIGG